MRNSDIAVAACNCNSLRLAALSIFPNFLLGLLSNKSLVWPHKNEWIMRYDILHNRICQMELLLLFLT